LVTVGRPQLAGVGLTAAPAGRQEATFASHLLYGSYLMTQLALPHLQQSDDPRVVLVSSGGMYNTPFPKWEVASGQSGKYDGQLAYAYAKRGQVLLCERWAAEVRPPWPADK
jgi:dehydrogenase/reductase SDR family protein 12